MSKAHESFCRSLCHDFGHVGRDWLPCTGPHVVLTVSYWAERTLRFKKMEPARASLLHEFQAPVNVLRFTFDLRALTSGELVALQLQSPAWSTATCISRCGPHLAI